MITKIFLSLIIGLTLGFTSCNKVTPAGFWKNYKDKFLLKNISDQGPYGGHRAMYWKAEKPNTFTSKSVIDFATKNSWNFVDSFNVKPEQMKLWQNGNQAVFPFSYAGFSDTMTNFETLNYFPRWINSELKVFAFKTNWEAVEPGNARQTEENGFIVLNNDGTEMSVYHLWGE